MTRVANQFIDPAGIVDTYDWPINQVSESPRGKKRSMSLTAPTQGYGIVRQQGAEAPQQIVYQGTMLTDDFRNAMIQWWTLCRHRSIYFQEFSGELYEVMIIDYEEQKNNTTFNRNDPTNMPHHYITYTLTMDVITALAGDWVQAEPPGNP